MTSTSQNTLPVRAASRGRVGGSSPRLAAARRGLSGVVMIGLVGAAWWWLATHHFTGGGHGTSPSSDAAADSGQPAIVRLPETVGNDEIGLVTVERRPLRAHLTVPGRLDYDARSRLDYDSPVDGVVSRMNVQVRQKVARGDSLAEVSSPEVGAARDEVRRREDERDIARKASEWSTTIADNLNLLLGVLDTHPPLEDVERQFAGRILGDYREKILGGYSKLLLVEKVNASTKQLGEGGVISGRIIDERTSNLEVARSSFAAACERARFDTLQERDKAKAALEQAERLVQISRETLRNLVGGAAEGKLSASAADDVASLADGISTIALRTPLDGIVEEIFVSRGQRVKGGDLMFIVADTRRLWVRAQIHEKQWTTVDVAVGQGVQVVVPGADEHRTTATINHVAATVDADSRSVPIVAELENDDAHYKPGMFVWVDLPQGEAHDAACVPAAAVMRHEGKPFVFVPVDGGYRRVDVDTGIETDDFVEVTRGLEVGQPVVARGAFVLKSELLLEQEG